MSSKRYMTNLIDDFHVKTRKKQKLFYYDKQLKPRNIFEQNKTKKKDESCCESNFTFHEKFKFVYYYDDHYLSCG